MEMMPEISTEFVDVLRAVTTAKMQMGRTVRKDSSNPFHKSRYASLGAHLELIEDALSENGLVLMQAVNGSYEKPILISTIYHVESGQWMKSYLPLPNPKNDSQGLGASITYMRRYSINSMFGLNAEDDDGETAAGRGQHPDYKKQEKQIKPMPIMPQKAQNVAESHKLTADQVSILSSMQQNLTPDLRKRMDEWLEKDFNSSDLSKLPQHKYAAILKAHENAVKLV